MEKSFNIYLTGVGGQGIGLLSTIIMHSCDRAGLRVVGADTHGLAQRGGIVRSMIRTGKVYSPLITPGKADLVVALEINEALRGINDSLKDGGTVLYYDTNWQPLEVRLSHQSKIDSAVVSSVCEKRGIRHLRVLREDLPDVRMQNIALLSTIAAHELIVGVNKEDYFETMKEIIPPRLQKPNLELFEKIVEKMDEALKPD